MLLIFGAIPQELSLFEDIRSKEVMLRQTGVGKVNAARVATQALCETSTQSSFVLIVGTCAGLRGDVGTTVATSHAFQHDYIIREDSQKHRVLPGTWWVESDAPLSQSGYVSSEHMLGEALKHPNISSGIILSGDTFLQSSTYSGRLLSHYGVSFTDNIVLDMESAAIAQVCDYYKVPWLCTKTVSDFGDTTSMEDFQANLLRATTDNYNAVKNLVLDLSS